MKNKKATKKFAASGKLKQTIQARHKQQKLKKQIQGRQQRRVRTEHGGKAATNRIAAEDVDMDGGDDDEEPSRPPKVPPKGKRKVKPEKDVDVKKSFLGGEDDEEDGEGNGTDGAEGDSASEDEDDAASFASIDDLDDDEGKVHLVQLSKLAEKDPEFYKYLQENDQELLKFDPNDGRDESGEDLEMELGDPADEEEQTPILTAETLKGWQRALLKHRSLRALRKLLVAFRSAAHMNEEDADLAWSIDDPKIFNKVVTTALKYTPIVLDHHIPYKELPDGRFKPPIASVKQQALQKLVNAYFRNVVHLITQLADPSTIVLALNESAKIIPHITSSRKIVKVYLKACLALWSSGSGGDTDDDGDGVRVAAFLAIRRLTRGGDQAIAELVLKGTYTTLVRSSKSTNAYSLPFINLMKNTACDVYLGDEGLAYQHAFGYIRQLAIHLRHSLKVKTKEAYKQVYNWQFVHCVDFWSQLLSRACEKQKEIQSGQESELKALIYPLVQVALGAIKLIPTPRYFPLHLHIARSLLTLIQRTQTYVPLAPYLLAIVASATSIPKPKSSTLKPLDFDLTIRAQTQYLKTRIYVEALVDETCYLLAEWGAAAQASVAFPELVVPITAGLRRSIKEAKAAKGGGAAKAVGGIKTLVERLDEGAKWVKERRTNVAFSPADRSEVDRWQGSIKIAETPVGKYATVLRKAREKRRVLLEKARAGEGEYVHE